MSALLYSPWHYDCYFKVFLNTPAQPIQEPVILLDAEQYDDLGLILQDRCIFSVNDEIACSP